jgi:hypothetical protein
MTTGQLADNRRDNAPLAGAAVRREHFDIRGPIGHILSTRGDGAAAPKAHHRGSNSRSGKTFAIGVEKGSSLRNAQGKALSL